MVADRNRRSMVVRMGRAAKFKRPPRPLISTPEKTEVEIRPPTPVPFMHLLVESYRDDSVERQAEIDLCLENNVRNLNFQKIHVFGKEKDLLRLPYSENLILNATDERMTYLNFFQYAEEQLLGERCIVANADIYFDNTLGFLQTYDLSSAFLCLTRWDVMSDGKSVFMDRNDSADCWMFQSPLKGMDTADFSLGRPGCDNKIAFLAKRAGYKLENPSKTIVTHHMHLTNKRNYTRADVVPGPYVPHLDPTKLEGI